MSRQIDRLSVLLIAVSAALWATDAHFRSYLLGHLSASQIVLGGKFAGLVRGGRAAAGEPAEPVAPGPL
jgi:hypothetical protein